MGLDIFLEVENSDQVFTPEYHEAYYDNHRLSRTFCNFMCRRNLPTDNPELDQIGKITGIDISPLYNMETYDNDGDLEFRLMVAETEAEKEEWKAMAAADKEKLRGNIDTVLQTITALVNQLSTIDNLPALLDDHGFDTLNSKDYFANFNIDKQSLPRDDHFGQDLQNFKRFLEYAKSKGAQTVYFSFG